MATSSVPFGLSVLASLRRSQQNGDAAVSMAIDTVPRRWLRLPVRPPFTAPCP